MEREGPGLSLAVVRDLREARVPAGPDELAAFETDVLAGFVLARAAAGLADATIRSDVPHLEQLRAWLTGGSALPSNCGLPVKRALLDRCRNATGPSDVSDAGGVAR